MREYEILFIMKPNLGEDQYKKTIESFESWITKTEGEITLLDPWGLRNLASTLNGLDKGYYVLCQFKCGNKTLIEIKKRIAVNEIIFRNLIVKMETIKEKETKTEE